MNEIKKNRLLPATADVIIIGSGFAGLAAAIEASQAGASVIVLEKMKAIGGNSIISDGGIAAPNTQEQLTQGIIDSAEMMAEDMMISGQSLNDPVIVKLICDQANATYQWSKTFLKVPYKDRVDIFGGHRVPRCYTPESISGQTMIHNMKNILDELNVPIFLGVFVESILLNEVGKVCGLRLNTNYRFNQEDSKTIEEIEVSRAVVIASGGFAADEMFRQQQNATLIPSIQTTNKRSATSELLRHCLSKGAASTNLSFIQSVPWTTPDESGYGKGALFGDYIVSSFGILVDPTTGNRFINECGDRKKIADAIFEIGHWVVGIADEASVQKAGWDLSLALNKGVIKTFTSLQDLAKAYQIPLNPCLKTIEAYNAQIIKGTDSMYHKPIENWMMPINHAPYYAMRIFPKTHYTMGGLVTNENAQVLRVDGSVFPGLFAAGEVTGMTHGANRLGSCSITECLVMGRIAGKNAAK